MPMQTPLARLKGLLTPWVAQRLLSRQRLLAKRAKAEQARRAAGRPHELHLFHQVDDPYSALLASCLPRLLTRYDVVLVPHVVGAPPDAAAPERERLVAYSRVDAERLARHHGLRFADPGGQPDPQAVAGTTARLVAAIAAGRFPELAGPMTDALWQRGQAFTEAPEADATTVAAHLQASNQLRDQLGHYLGAMLYHEGEWYWGLDRLHHLERRLQDLGLRRNQQTDAAELMFPPEPDLSAPLALDHAPDIDFFFSLRSPYSAIVTPRVFELGRLSGAQVRLRFVLPMVMRGLPVPRAKRSYISLDAAREAHQRGIPFGRLNDPVGRPTERGLALIPWAERAGVGQAYVASFMRGVWAEGLDAGSDRGLRRIAERAGLSWSTAQDALADESWRAQAERNRSEMFGLGLWGVPSFKVGDLAVWGQDRLWAVREALQS